MKIRDARNAAPDLPEMVGERVRMEVNRQLSAGERKRSWTPARAMVLAALCVVCVSAVAVAAVAYHMTLEQRGAYSVEIKVASQGETAVPEKVADIAFTPGYVPEGMVWRAEDKRIASPDTPHHGGVSISRMLLAGGGEDALSVTDKNVVESEQRTFAGREGVYLRFDDLRQDGTFNQRIVTLCPEYGWVVTLFIGDDVSKEDAIRIAENMMIEQTDVMIDTADLLPWGFEYAEAIADERPVSIAAGDIALHGVGEAFGVPAHCSNAEDAVVNVRVDSVQIADDLSLLSDGVPEDWQGTMGADGKLVANTLSYIKTGDGVNTLDTVIRTEQSAQKLVYVTLTYTNGTDAALEDVLYNGALMRIAEDGGRLTVVTDAELAGNGIDRISGDSAAAMGDMGYWSPRPDTGNGGNYIARLAPGESATVNMAWIVNESDLAHMFLNVTGGASYAFDDAARECGIVDLRVK